jgi:hypothetical protein
MPRGEMSGRATFVDEGHRLCCEVYFGKVEDAAAPLLRRPDSFAGAIYRLPPAWKTGDPLPSVGRGLVRGFNGVWDGREVEENLLRKACCHY